MTEAEWLASTDPDAMLWFLFGTGSDRKLRLFGCACCRRMWHLLGDERSRRAVDAAEGFVDGKCGRAELRAAARAAAVVLSELEHSKKATGAEREAGQVACKLAGVTHPLFMGDNHPATEQDRQLAHAAARVAGFFIDRREQCHILRDIFGLSRFRPVTFNPTWLSWRDSTIRKLAQSIYDDRAFDRLPILADALEDAGCTDAQILDHCRRPSEHVRGCWVVDALLGKG